MEINLAKYHPVATKIVNLLHDKNFWFETFEHEAVKTSKEAASVRDGYTQSQGAKAIIIRAKFTATDKKFVMLVMPGDKRFDNTKVKAILKAKDIRFATEEEVSEVTGGVLPGGVPPFGNLFSLEVIADLTLFENQKIVFNAGDRSFSIAMNSKDYIELVKPKLDSFI